MISFSAATASAQAAPPPLFVAPSLSLPPVPELRLSFPVQPLHLSFTPGEEVTSFSGGPLQLYRLEALWLERPRLQLLTTATNDRAFELDCRLSCQAVVNRAFELDARVPLPGLGKAVPSTYVFARSTTYSSALSARPTGMIRAGFAGYLNF